MRSIPIAIIPGCREYPFEYERYPKKIVALHFSSLPTYEAAAEFYSYLAFPDPLEETQRKKYSLALSRWAVLEVGKYDKTWNTTEQMIRPTIFSQPEKLYLNIYKRGSIRLWQRAQFAFMMLFQIW